MTDKSDLIATDASAALIHVPPPAELAASELSGTARRSMRPRWSTRRRSDGDAELFGQSRALDAIRLAIGIDAPGYNVFVSGLRSRARARIGHALLSEKAAHDADPRRLGLRQ